MLTSLRNGEPKVDIPMLFESLLCNRGWLELAPGQSISRNKPGRFSETRTTRTVGLAQEMILHPSFIRPHPIWGKL